MKARFSFPAAVAVATLFAADLAAQDAGAAAVTGTVTDSASLPIAGAEVIVRPGARRTFTDSGGRFAVRGLEAGAYTITARKLGYASKESFFDLSKTGDGLKMDFQLARHVTLDTIKVASTRTCAGLKLAGFVCRRSNGNGRFFDYPDIDDMQKTFVADIFRDDPGLMVVMTRTERGGPVPRVRPRPGRCLAIYVNGFQASISNPMPDLSSELAAIEVYASPDSIPLADRRLLFRDPRAKLGSLPSDCQVIFYWTGNNGGPWRPSRPIQLSTS